MNISIDDDYIRSVFEKFLARMKQEVLCSYDGFLESVILVDKIKGKASAAGVCYYEKAMNEPGKVRIEFAESECTSLTEKALIGVFSHEFGHLEDRLFHGDSCEWLNLNVDLELVANTIACYWGFKEEILQMHKEMSFKENAIPLNFSIISDERIKDYWESRKTKRIYR